MSLVWIPEQYPSSGTLGAAGFYKLLGRPRLDPLTVLVRETAQNSWDARDGSGTPVRFRVDAKVLSWDERESLTQRVFVQHDRIVGNRHLSAVLAEPHLVGMYISDRNTHGLGGPVTASRVDEGDVYDWVDFVLNVGTGNSQAHTGGTYGFGKTIAYVISRANSVVVHSRSVYKGQVVTRLMACALGERFSMDGRNFTGRHWWGVPTEGASAPIEGHDAESLARSLGMPEFGPDELGTNLLVVGPDFGGRAPVQGMNFIAEAMLWQLWPKTAGFAASPPMELAVSWEGNEIPIPTPNERPPLAGFVQAFTELTSPDSDGVVPLGYEQVPIKRMRPQMAVGDLATVPMVYQSRAIVDDGHDPSNPDSPAPAAMIPSGGSHHVALLRSPNLIVEYMEGPPAPESGMEWAGVFKCVDAVDHIFAQAEPPTHDSWSPDLLETGPNRSIVRKALQDVRSAMNTRWGSRATTTDPVASTTAVVAERLSHLVGMSDGSGPGRDPKPAPGRKPQRHLASVDFLSAKPLIDNGSPATMARVRVSPARGSSSTRLSAQIGVALDANGSDSDLDPELAFLSADCGGVPVELRGRFAEIHIDSSTPTDVDFIVRRSTETSVLFDFTADAATEVGDV